MPQLINQHMAFHILDTFLQNGSCEVTYTRLAEELSISCNLAKEYLTSYIQNSNPVPNYSLLLELHKHPDYATCHQDISIPSVEFKLISNPSQELQETLLRLKEEQKQVVNRVQVFSVWNKAPSDPITLWNCEISLQSKKNESTLFPSNIVYHVNPDKSLPLRVQYQSHLNTAIPQVSPNAYVTPNVVHSPNSVLSNPKPKETAVQTVDTNSLDSNRYVLDEETCFGSHLTNSTVSKPIELQKNSPRSTSYSAVQLESKTLKSNSLKSAVKNSTSSASPLRNSLEKSSALIKNDLSHIDEKGDEDELMESVFEQDLWESNDDKFDTKESPSKHLTDLNRVKQTSQEKCTKKIKVSVEKQRKQGKYTVVEVVDQIQHLAVDAPLNGECKLTTILPAPVVRKKQNNLFAFFKPSTK